MTDMQEFAHLWNGSQPGWVVMRRVESWERLEVLFMDGGPTAVELKSLRAMAPALVGKPASEAFAALKGQSSFPLGEFETEAARQLRQKCEAVGLRVACQTYSAIRYSLMNEVSSVFLVIEDEALCTAVAEEAAKRGLPVRDNGANA